MYSAEAIEQLAKYDMVTIEKFVPTTADFHCFQSGPLTIVAASWAGLLAAGGTPCVELNIPSKGLRSATSSLNSTKRSIR
jgi:hypothetical protein